MEHPTLADFPVLPLAERLRAIHAPPGSLGLFWLGQAGFGLCGTDTTVLIDPFLSDHPDRLVPLAGRPETFDFVRAVLATHEHWDHLDLASWPALAAAAPRARFVAPRPVVEQVLAAGLSADRVIGAEADVELALGGARVFPIPARHGVHVSDAYTFGREISAGLYRYLGYVVELNGVRVYHAGDTIAYDGMAERLRRLRVDVALLPINGRDYYREQQDIVGNLTYREAADLAADAGVDLVIPMHYEMFAANAEQPGTFVDYLRRTHPEVTALAMGRHAGFIYTRPAPR